MSEIIVVEIVEETIDVNMTSVEVIEVGIQGPPGGVVAEETFFYTTAMNVPNVSRVPPDGTIHQNNEGYEFFTGVYTPKKIGNILHIELCAFHALSDIYNGGVSSIFINNVADALSSNHWAGMGNALAQRIQANGEFTVASLSDITIKYRAGAVNDGKTLYINCNNSGVATVGAGKIMSYIKVTERKPKL